MQTSYLVPRLIYRAWRRASRAARSDFMLIIIYTAAFALTGAVLFFFVESDRSLADSVWWALVTMTTVGYGDITPATRAGRVIAVVLMFGGVSVLALISASIASIMVERRLKEGKGLYKVNVKDHIIIAGWGSQGEVLLENLNTATTGRPRVIVLINELGEQFFEPLVGKYKNIHLRYVHGDPTQDFVLQRANVKRAGEAIVLAGRYGQDVTEDAVDSRTIKVVMGIRSYSADIKIFAEVRSVQNEQHLRRAGADEIISSAEMGANVLANAPLSPGLPLMLKELLGFHGNGFRTVDIPHRLVGKPLRELFAHFREQECILVALLSESRSMGLEDLIQDSGDSFIDAFIQTQFAQTEKGLMERNRFTVRINPGDDEVVVAGERAMVIMRQED